MNIQKTNNDLNETPFLFTEKWKMILCILLILSLTFLDKIIPPFGIPIAVISAFVLYRWRKLPLKLLGIFKPKSWVKTIVIGLTVGILFQVFSVFVLEPAFEFFGIAEETPAFYKTVEGNNSMLIIYLLVSWTTAGFGEELIFRSFFLGQFVSFFQNSKYRWVISLAISSVLFGLLHYNNGLEAMVSTGMAGVIFGLVYLKTGRNIWAAYIAHAVANTVGFLIIYYGFY